MSRSEFSLVWKVCLLARADGWRQRPEAVGVAGFVAPVAQVSKSAGDDMLDDAGMFAPPAGLETRDTAPIGSGQADWEVCATEDEDSGLARGPELMAARARVFRFLFSELFIFHIASIFARRRAVV
jgi:hypothetical protein